MFREPTGVFAQLLDEAPLLFNRPMLKQTLQDEISEAITTERPCLRGQLGDDFIKPSGGKYSNNRSSTRLRMACLAASTAWPFNSSTIKRSWRGGSWMIH